MFNVTVSSMLATVQTRRLGLFRNVARLGLGLGLGLSVARLDSEVPECSILAISLRFYTVSQKKFPPFNSL